MTQNTIPALVTHKPHKPVVRLLLGNGVSLTVGRVAIGKLTDGSYAVGNFKIGHEAMDGWDVFADFDEAFNPSPRESPRFSHGEESGKLFLI